MKRNIYKFTSGAKLLLLALGLTTLPKLAQSQTTYTFAFTGGQQTMALQPGTYTLEAWGAEGGTNLGNGSTTFTQSGGKGGYAAGIYTITSPTTVYINVGGRGANSTGVLSQTVAGGYNGGGYGSANSTSGKTSGAGGGGASHIATATGVLSSLSTNTTAVLIVGGGGGGPGESNYANNNTAYNSNGGFGGGLSGLQNSTTSYLGRHGQGGTQVAGGGGGDNGSAVAGPPLQGSFGAGGYNNVAGVNTSAGGSGAGGGGGGWYGGGAGWVATGTAYMAGAGGGGSSYIGGVNNGTTVIFGNASYVPNPDVAGDGFVRIIQQCSINMFVNGQNPASVALCSGQSLTLTTNAVSNFSWSTGATGSSIIVAPTSNTVYSLVGTSSQNCIATTVRNISVNAAAPVLSISNPSSNICLGQTVTLTATGALTYTWANAGVVNGQSFTPVSTAVYTVSGSNGCGTTVATTTINIVPLAVTASSSSSLVCQGYTATLTANSSVNGYTWQPGGMTSSATVVSPTAATIYTVTASDGICNGTQTVQVNTKTTPTISASASTGTICPGDQVVLTASGGSTYVWNPGNLTGTSVTVSPATSTLYVVAGTNSLNCTSSANQVIIVSASPTVNITSSKTATCPGGLVVLTASGANSYVWINGPSTAAYSINPTSTSVYTVVGTQNGNPCTNTKTVSITVVVPNVTSSSNTSICPNGTTQLTASGANSYAWNGIPGGTITVSPAATSVYTLVAQTNSANITCPTTRTVQITVNPTPVLTVTPTRSVICKGETNTLTASGAASYTWQGTLGTSNTVSVKPTATTMYTLTGTSSLGCNGDGQVTTIVSACNGIEEFGDHSSIQVYPNPNNGQFTVKADTEMTLNLVNTLGQHVRSIELNIENGLSVDISGLAKGVYYLSAVNGTNQSGYTKLIVN